MVPHALINLRDHDLEGDRVGYYFPLRIDWIFY